MPIFTPDIDRVQPGDRLGDWVATYEPDRDRRVWVRDRVTTGPYKPEWNWHWRQGEDWRVTVTVPLDDDGAPGWNACVRLDLVDGQIQPVEITFAARPEADRRPSPMAVVNRLRLGALMTQIDKELGQAFIRRFMPPDPPEWRRAAMRLRRGTRGALDDGELAVWVEKYLTAVDEHGRRAVKKLAEQEQMSPDTIRRYITKDARDRGLIIGIQHGRAGGEMTGRCRELLKDLQNEAGDGHGTP